MYIVHQENEMSNKYFIIFWLTTNCHVHLSIVVTFTLELYRIGGVVQAIDLKYLVRVCAYIHRASNITIMYML